MSMPRTLGILAALALIVGAWLFAVDGASQAAGTSRSDRAAGAPDPIQLLKSDVDGIVFDVDISALEWDHKMVGDVEYDVVTVTGFGSRSTAGSPQVPTRRILLGIPMGADYRLHVLVQESETVDGAFRLLPAPTPFFTPDPEYYLDREASAQATAGWEYVEDASIYGTNLMYPETIARVADEGFVRDQRYVAVQVNPVQYNPVSGEVVIYWRFRVQIDLINESGLGAGASSSDASFEPILSASLLNYESAADWRGRRLDTVLPASPAADMRDVGSPAFKISVNEDGIYQVTAADLQNLGVPVGEIDASKYKLYYRDIEVRVRVLETGNGKLESLWFYGEQARTKYTDTNVYWLTYDLGPSSDPGLRMDTRSVPPDPAGAYSEYYSTTIRLEEDNLYYSYMPWVGDPGMNPTDPWDHWFWNYTYYPDVDPAHPPELTLPTAISGLYTAETYSARLQAFFSGMTQVPSANPDHCVEFYVNGVQLGQGPYEWEGQYSAELVDLPFSSSHLLEGINTVEVHACQSALPYDVTVYDWFGLEVRRSYLAEDDSLAFEVAETGWQYRMDGFSVGMVEIFDVSDVYSVSYLVGAEVTQPGSSYSVAFSDQAAEVGTRYLAVTSDRIKTPAEIVEYTPAGLTSSSDHVDYIIIAPEQFVPYVQPLVAHRAARGLVVQVVELVPIFDEFNYGIYSPEAIRDFLAYAYENWRGEPPANEPPSYVLLVGDGTYDYRGYLSDGNPNLMPPYLAWVDYYLGETAADNRYVTVSGDDPLPDMHIGRLPAETTAQVSAMVSKIITYETNPAPRDWSERVLFVTDDPDLAGNFYWYSDDLVNNYLPGPYVPIKAYYEETCSPGDACKQMILETLNSTGALLVNYIGHGGGQVWTGNGVWGINDLSSLVPTTRLPVMLPMTCDEGRFHEARYDALGEAIVRLEGMGAVASWSPTGEGTSDGHHYLNTRFLTAVLQEGVRELGVAADLGKMEVSYTGYYTDLIETYHLFGDPAMRLNALVDVAVGQAYDGPEAPAPNEPVTITLTFTNAGPSVESGLVLTDLLPAVLVNPSVAYSSTADITLEEGSAFVWTINNLEPGTSGQIEIHAVVDPGWPEPDASFINLVRIRALTYDHEPSNNVTWLGVNTKKVYLPLILKRN